jgi:hypothetical protein
MPSQVLSDLDEDTLALYPFDLIERDELASLCDSARGVEAQLSSDLSRNAARDYFENLASKQDKNTVDELLSYFLVMVAAFQREVGGLVYQVPIDWHLSSMMEKRRIGGSVLRSVPGNGLNVTRVRNNGCVLFQGFQ